jgi:hypothetical protein
MRRGDGLGAGIVDLGAWVAGCAGPAHLGVTEMDAPDRSDEDGETHLTFERDGEEYLTLTAGYSEGYRESVNQYPFRLSTSHREGTRLDSLSYRLYRANRAQQFSEFYLRTHGGTPWPELTLQRDRDGQGVRLAVPDLGFQGTGTVSLDFIVQPDQPSTASDPFVLGLDATFRLSDTSPFGRDYRARATEDVEFPPAGGQ